MFQKSEKCVNEVTPFVPLYCEVHSVTAQHVRLYDTRHVQTIKGWPQLSNLASARVLNTANKKILIDDLLNYNGDMCSLSISELIFI